MSDFETTAAKIRDEYKRLNKAAELTKDIQKRHTLQTAAKAQAYRMKLLLSQYGIKATTNELFNKYLK